MSVPEVDFHSHLIPGVDDGSHDSVETIAMARALASLGVRRVHLTPHQFRMGNEFSELDLMRLTDNVWRLLARAGVQIEVVRSAEYFYGERFMRAVYAGEDLITFDRDAERCVLVELPLERPVIGVGRTGHLLLQRGVRPVMAHPERRRRLFRVPDRIERWRNAGWLFQLNLLSLVGSYGREACDNARVMIRHGLCDLTGSDLHRPHQIDALCQAYREFASLRRQAAAESWETTRALTATGKTTDDDNYMMCRPRRGSLGRPGNRRERG